MESARWNLQDGMNPQDRCDSLDGPDGHNSYDGYNNYSSYSSYKSNNGYNGYNGCYSYRTMKSAQWNLLNGIQKTTMAVAITKALQPR